MQFILSPTATPAVELTAVDLFDQGNVGNGDDLYSPGEARIRVRWLPDINREFFHQREARVIDIDGIAAGQRKTKGTLRIVLKNVKNLSRSHGFGFFPGER